MFYIGWGFAYLYAPGNTFCTVRREKPVNSYKESQCLMLRVPNVLYTKNTQRTSKTIYILFFGDTLYGTLQIKISSVSRWFNLFEPYN